MITTGSIYPLHEYLLLTVLNTGRRLLPGCVFNYRLPLIESGIFIYLLCFHMKQPRKMKITELHTQNQYDDE